jgi:hypothetical protein
MGSAQPLAYVLPGAALLVALIALAVSAPEIAPPFSRTGACSTPFTRTIAAHRDAFQKESLSAVQADPEMRMRVFSGK